jgi:hypothetical protein
MKSSKVAIPTPQVRPDASVNVVWIGRRVPAGAVHHGS